MIYNLWSSPSILTISSYNCSFFFWKQNIKLQYSSLFLYVFVLYIVYISDDIHSEHIYVYLFLGVFWSTVSSFLFGLLFLWYSYIHEGLQIRLISLILLFSFSNNGFQGYSSLIQALIILIQLKSWSKNTK